MQKILIIQTAFIGDVILSTAIGNKISTALPDAEIHYLVRKGNESLLNNLHFIKKVWVWDKKQHKIRNLFKLGTDIKREKYDKVINLHRFMSSGILTIMSQAQYRYGFNKNPLSLFLTNTIKHEIGDGRHETARNHDLIAGFTDSIPAKPILNPHVNDYKAVQSYTSGSYITIAPASVWYTKQFPAEKWIEFIEQIPLDIPIIMIGAHKDTAVVEKIQKGIPKHTFVNLCGRLSFLESAALMQQASMNYVNDSAPLHIASAVDAPVRAVFCSTVPDFGFGPLSTNSKTVEIKKDLPCRPCGLHGKKACPIDSFECAMGIDTESLAAELRFILHQENP